MKLGFSRLVHWRIETCVALVGLGLVVPQDARPEADRAPASPLGTPPADLALLRVWTCTNQEMEMVQGVSTDARWVSYASADTGELMVRDLVKRKDHCVVKVPPTDVWHRLAYGSLVSPHGGEIVYVWDVWDLKRDLMQLRVVRRDGKQDRLLYQNKEVSWLSPACWSADSSHVVAVVWLSGASPSQKQILLLSVRDGSIRVLKSLQGDDPDPEGVCLDPSGRFLAYDTQATSPSSGREIRVVSVSDLEEAVVLPGPADNRCLGWSPDGQRLLFGSNRRSTIDCWVQRMENGRPAGEPELLRQNLGEVSALGITRKGGLCFGVDCTSTEVRVAKIDFASGEFVSKPKSLTGKDRGHDVEPHWSPDGKQLAYISEKDGVRVLRVRSADTGEERMYSPSIGRFHTPVWSVDGKSMLLHSSSSKGELDRFRLDLTGGEAQRIKADEVFPLPFTNRTCTFRCEREKKQVLAKHLDTGEEKVLYQGGEKEVVGSVQVAPDGEHLAIMSNLGECGVWRHMVKLISTAGGESRELIGGTNYLAGFAWFPDSRQILCCGWNEAWVLSIDGQPPRKLKAHLEGTNPSINSDGQQVAYVKWNFRSELWLMENAVPPSGKTRKFGF